MLLYFEEGQVNLIHVSTMYATNFLLKTTHRRIERYELLGVNWKSEFEKQN